MSIHRFPPKFIDRASFPPQRVVLAPDPLEIDLWHAWVVGARGPVILESGARDFAATDAYGFARRFGLKVEVRNEPLIHGRDRYGDNGTVYVVPSMRDGGSWDVCHESRSGDSDAVIGSAFSFDRAAELARIKAIEIGAEVSL